MTNPSMKISFGNVSFRKEQIKEKSDYQAKNGQQRYSVTFKTGQKVDFPEQKERAGIVTETNEDGGVTLFANSLNNATIYGNPNKTDRIMLSENSNGNSIIVDNEKYGNATAIGSAILPGTGTAIGCAIDTWQQATKKQNDIVGLGTGTKNNIVKMGKEDTTYIPDASTLGQFVKGKGVCEQNIHVNGLL